MGAEETGCKMTIDASLNKRLDRVVRRHERMKRNGVVHTVGPDGLIRSRPRLIRPRFPLRGAAVVVGLLIAFKALLVAQLGSLVYDARVAELRTGSLIEQAGGFVLQQDPVTVALSDYLNRYVFQN